MQGMKKAMRLLWIVIILGGIDANAQPELWSMAPYNAATGIGAIFKIDLSGSNYSTPYILTGSRGRISSGRLNAFHQWKIIRNDATGRNA